MVTEDEIKAIINEGTETGAIEATEQEIIERVFHLGDRNITSLMTHRSDIIWFEINDTEVTIKEKIFNEFYTYTNGSYNSICKNCENNSSKTELYECNICGMILRQRNKKKHEPASV